MEDSVIISRNVCDDASSLEHVVVVVNESTFLIIDGLYTSFDMNILFFIIYIYILNIFNLIIFDKCF